MTKIVINRQYGGFGLSGDAILRYAEIKGITLYPRNDGMFHHWYSDPGFEEHWGDYDIPRDDPALVQVVEEMGDAADHDYATLKVVEIPDDVEWVINEYDGYESIHEQHRVWP